MIERRNCIAMENAKKYKRIKIVGNIMAIALLISVSIAFIYEIVVRCSSQDFSHVTSCLKSLFCDNGHMMDGFGILWGITISILLFFLGFYNSYWYGIQMKKLIKLSISGLSIYVMGVLYIVYCPLVYMAESFGWYFIVLSGVIGTFVIFVAMVVYIILIMRKERISVVLEQSTIEKLKCMDYSDGIRSEIERLPIMDMVVHLNYENEDEIEHLLVVLSNIIVEVEKYKKKTVYEDILCLSWMTNIIKKSGISTKFEQERTAYIAKRLWIIIDNSVNWGAKKLYLLEILVPLLDLGQAFKDVWKIIGDYRSQTILYLYLYMEYLNVFEKEEHGLEKLIFVNYDFLREQCALWDCELAWRLWLSWCNFWNQGSTMAISRFYKFCEDIRAISKNNRFRVRTKTMKKVLMRVEKSI